MKLLAALLVLAAPAFAAAPPGCASLCGQWQLDTALSPAVEPAIDAALREYTNPRDKYRRKAASDDTIERMKVEMEQSLGPIRDRPLRGDMRGELLSLLTAPAQLNFEARGSDIYIQSDAQPARRISPGTPRARVDAVGTAKITAGWKSSQLRVNERYDRKHANSEIYAVQRNDGTLVVTREVQRPGMKPLRLRAVYRRA